MIVFLNGAFVPEEQAVVSIFDRSFRYGDGLFETIPVFNRQPFRWTPHLERLRHSADFLRIPPPFAPARLREIAGELLDRNGRRDGVLRLTLSRGTGPRQYAPTGREIPFLAMTLHDLPARMERPWKLMVSRLRVTPGDPLARHKTGSRLHHVLAAAEAAENGADEALLLDTDGSVLEGAAGNVFWIEHGAVCTPPLEAAVLPGVTRAVVRELCETTRTPWRECNATVPQLLNSEGLFLTLSTRGVVEVDVLGGQAVPRSPLIARLAAAYEECVMSECSVWTSQEETGGTERGG
jgi:branched-subunit amino acid aminotransferase/4-amino-4-deoxychorismate lyase